MIQEIKSGLKRLPPLRRIFEHRDNLLEVRKRCGAYLPGHFYSPLPDFDEVLQQHVFDETLRQIPGIDMNESEQLELLHELCRFYSELPFPEQEGCSTRYYLDNGYYAYSDGVLLYAMLRYLQPKRYIEIGSGFSSVCALDTRDFFLSGNMHCRFVDPDISRLKSLLGNSETGGDVEIVNKRLQEVPASDFEQLEAGDILFIDSSHVLKTGSDVHYYMFSIFPRLRPGVYVHIHDVFYPFEYPKGWLLAGRAWNEVYAVRAMLTDCPTFKIVLFNTYIQKAHNDWFSKCMPLCLKSRKGIPPGSIWLKKTTGSIDARTRCESRRGSRGLRGLLPQARKGRKPFHGPKETGRNS